MNARSGADIDYIIGRAHGVFIVFNYYERITEVTHTLKRSDKLIVIALMKSYARLVKNIQHSHKRRAYLSSKSYALALPSGKRTCRTRQRKIIKTDILKKAQTAFNFFQNQRRNHLLAVGQNQSVDKIKFLCHRQLCKLVDIKSAHRNGKRLFF